MRKRVLITFFILLVAPFVAKAQRLVYNEKAPSIEIESIIKGKEIEKGKPTYIDFFVVGRPQNERQLEAFKRHAKKFGEAINFVIISKSDKEQVAELFSDKEINYSVIYDLEGKTFKNFGVRFIPFAVLIDKKGNFVWQGKNSSLTEDVLLQSL